MLLGQILRALPIHNCYVKPIHQYLQREVPNPQKFRLASNNRGHRDRYGGQIIHARLHGSDGKLLFL